MNSLNVIAVLLTTANITLPTFAAGNKTMTTKIYNRPTPEEEQIILRKATEKTFSGSRFRNAEYKSENKL